MNPPLLPVEEARRRILSGVAQVAQRMSVNLVDGLDRVLATPVAARLTQPPFDASAMDGYAVKAQDVATIGTELRVIGVSSAGHGFSGEMTSGETVRIFTGAPVPAGADTVLLQEDAERVGDDRILNRFSPERGRHIRRAGQDFVLGETVIDAGLILDQSRLLLAAGANHASVEVYRKPRIGLLATGDELVTPGSARGPHQIVASSTFGVAALAREAGAEVIDLGIAPDDRQAIADAVTRGLHAGIDVLVTLGGASVGDHDLVQTTLTGMGMELDFWKIAMRPGKPLMVGALNDVKVLGLPGNPVSTMVCAILFLEPLIAHLARRPPPLRNAVARSQTDLAANDHRQDYLRAALIRDAEGGLLVRSFGKQDSSQMKIFSQSDALIVRPPHAEPLPAGADCPVIVLRAPGLQSGG